MLILGRKQGQSLYIGDDIKIKVMGVNRYGYVSIGIEAPKNVTILREEIADCQRNVNNEYNEED